MFDLFDFDEDGIVDASEFAVGIMIIEAAGLVYDELENMDEEEREKVLREAGLDPDDFDF